MHLLLLLRNLFTLHMVDEAEVQLSHPISLLEKGCKNVIFILPEVDKYANKVAAIKKCIGHVVKTHFGKRATARDQILAES